MVESANDLMPQMLDYIAVTSSSCEKMSSEINEHRELAEKRSAAVPEVLQALLDAQCVMPEQQKQAEDLLACPVATLGFLKSAAAKIKEQTAELVKLSEEKTASVRELGSGVDVDRATDFDVRDTPFVGVITSEKKASDRAFEAIMSDPLAR